MPTYNPTSQRQWRKFTNRAPATKTIISASCIWMAGMDIFSSNINFRDVGHRPATCRRDR